jgi:hypothetical protein
MPANTRSSDGLAGRRLLVCCLRLCVMISISVGLSPRTCRPGAAVSRTVVRSFRRIDYICVFVIFNVHAVFAQLTITQHSSTKSVQGRRNETTSTDLARMFDVANENGPPKRAVLKTNRNNNLLCRNLLSAQTD